MENFLSLMLAPLNHWGILISGMFVFFVLGWFWYNPIGYIGRKWMELNHLEKPKPEDMPKPYEFIVMLIMQLFMGFSVTWIVMILWLLVTMTVTPLFATLFVVKIYMGFVFIKDLGHWYFEQKPFTLVLIGIGYWLVGILAVCGLLTFFL